MNLLSLLALNGWGPPASRTPASNGFHTMRGSIVTGDNSFRLGCVGVGVVWKAFCARIGTVYPPSAAGFTNPSQSAISQWGWGFHTVRGGIDPGYHRFLPRFVGVADVWNYF